MFILLLQPPYMVRQNTADPSRGGVGMHLPYAVVYPGFNNLSSFHAGFESQIQ